MAYLLTYIHAVSANKTIVTIQGDESLIAVFLAMNRTLSPTSCLCETRGVVDRIAVWPNTFVSDDLLKHSFSELRQVFEDDARNRGLFKPFPSADKQPGVHRIEYGNEERRQRFRKVSPGEGYLSFGHRTNSKMTLDSF